MMNSHFLTELSSLQWRHNGRDSVSNHQPHHCFPNRLFSHRSKKTSRLRVTGLCVGNSPGTGEFPAQIVSNAENVSIDDVIMIQIVANTHSASRIFVHSLYETHQPFLDTKWYRSQTAVYIEPATPPHDISQLHAYICYNYSQKYYLKMWWTQGCYKWSVNMNWCTCIRISLDVVVAIPLIYHWFVWMVVFQMSWRLRLCRWVVSRFL